MPSRVSRHAVVALLPYLFSCLICVLVARPGYGVPDAGSPNTTPQPAAATPGPPTVLRGVGNVLYDQTGNPTANGLASQDFTDAGGVNDGLDAEAADDFEVPESRVWAIEGIDVPGFFSAGSPGPIDTARIVLYADDAGQPGAVVCDLAGIVPTSQVGGSMVLDLPAPCDVEAGRAWVSVRAEQPLVPNGQWFWFRAAAQTFDASVWRNPGDGFSTGCVDFTIATDCDGVDPDLAFALRGIERNAVVPLPIPTLGRLPMLALVLVLALLSVGVMRRRPVGP